MSSNERYASFISNPSIAAIAEKQKWTVSTSDKMPIDMHVLKCRNQITGAAYKNELSLTTLPRVNDLIPDALNYTFYLDAYQDNIVVLDIEPTCPEDIRRELTAMPCLYCETSMSGKGVHMVFPFSADCLNDLPQAQQKVAFKHPKKYYEILLNHYVAFTANQLSHQKGSFEKFKTLFLQMAKEQKQIEKINVDVVSMETVNTKYAGYILDMLKKQRYLKTLDDFGEDYSKFEFAYIAFVNRCLQRILSAQKDHVYTPSEQAWFLYKTAYENLPHREKHEQCRCGMPWLLYLAKTVLETYEAEKMSRKAKKEELP